MRAVLTCLVPILVLQGGWAIKNYVVYGVLSPATSAWGGMHALAGLRAAGLEKEFEDSRREWRSAAPGGPPPAPRAPRDIIDRDAAVERQLGLSNPPLNTLGMRIALAQDQRDFFHFVRTHPDTMLRKWWAAYHIFWQPIANYGRWWVSLFVVSNRITDPFDFPGIVQQWRAGQLPDVQYVASGTHPSLWVASPPPSTFAPDERGRRRPYRVTPTSLYTFRWCEPFVLMLEIVATHLLLPLVGVLWAATRVWRGRAAVPLLDPLRMTALLVGAALYAYLAAAANLVETAENMRYRVEVEPVLWVMTLICITELAGLIRAATSRKTASVQAAVG